MSIDTDDFTGAKTVPENPRKSSGWLVGAFTGLGFLALQAEAAIVLNNGSIPAATAFTETAQTLSNGFGPR